MARPATSPSLNRPTMSTSHATTRCVRLPGYSHPGKRLNHLTGPSGLGASGGEPWAGAGSGLGVVGIFTAHTVDFSAHPPAPKGSDAAAGRRTGLQAGGRGADAILGSYPFR